MNKYYFALVIVVSLFLLFCYKNDDSLMAVVSDFETEILFGENQAIVNVTNLSQNATSYQWTATNGIIENGHNEINNRKKRYN
ncbi:hypothetical protein N9X82_00590 [Polaribacter sp.]|jgi:hypothetical protein|nr:hypothetical protein [Polaribacter sp.]MDC1374052.1 hypothetical protein [Polaribacter sp.]